MLSNVGIKHIFKTVVAMSSINYRPTDKHTDRWNSQILCVYVGLNQACLGFKFLCEIGTVFANPVTYV